MQKIIKAFCVNPYWKEYYETAPSNVSKRYIELEFYYSYYLGAISNYSEYKTEIDMLEKQFKEADWIHLYKFCANNPKKVYYKK